MMALDAASMGLVEQNFLQVLSSHFNLIAYYAMRLLYLFALLECVMFGLAWAIQQHSAWEQLFFKVLKIGLLLFIIHHYPLLLNSILSSFSYIGSQVTNNSSAHQFITNPALLWQYGYNGGIILLKLATESSGFALPLIYMTIGLAILVLFALLGIQVIIQLVGFYLTALTALIMLPLSAYTPCQDMLAQALQSLLRAGVRVMVITMVIAIAVTTWQSADMLTITSESSISLLLGLLFTALLFLALAVALPKLAANAVGRIQFTPAASTMKPNLGLTTAVTTHTATLSGSHLASTPSLTLSGSAITHATALPVATQPLNPSSLQASPTSASTMPMAASTPPLNSQQLRERFVSTANKQSALTGPPLFDAMDSGTDKRIILAIKRTLEQILDEQKRHDTLTQHDEIEES